MTKWFHRCDLDWLCSRQSFLTATEIKELLPVTKSGRKRTVDDESYLKIFAKKYVNLTEDDCVSTGVAARGHVLEPYAIEKFNENMKDVELHHWDDVLITRKKPKLFELAFSPDAMDIEQDIVIGSTYTDEMKVIGEVKSYSPEKHLICGCTPKEELEERWQIAAAMAVCLNIEHAYLIFYNPAMAYQMFVVDYDRSELNDEINMILEAEGNWLEWVKKFKFDTNTMFEGEYLDEERIVKEILKREELNPESERSVVL